MPRSVGTWDVGGGEVLGRWKCVARIDNGHDFSPLSTYHRPRPLSLEVAMEKTVVPNCLINIAGASH